MRRGRREGTGSDRDSRATSGWEEKRRRTVNDEACCGVESAVDGVPDEAGGSGREEDG